MVFHQAGFARRLGDILGRLPQYVPDRLIVKPIDPWPGDAREGHMICAESRNLRQENYKAWPERMQRFFWLRDLRAMGGEEARLCAKDMVMQWISLYGVRARSRES